MKTILLHVRGALIAVVALALSAGLAFAAHPSAASFSLDSSVSSQAAGHEASSGADEDVEVDETSGADEDANDVGEVDELDEVDGTTGGTTDQTTGQDPTVDTAGTNCLTDPTTLTVEALAAMSHGSIVCWAAHQTTWPVEFKNHGAWVSSWAHLGKGTVAVAASATTKVHKTNAHKPKVHKAKV